MLSPSPINFVFGGKTHVEGMTMGAAAVVAGSRMVEGGGVVISVQGLAVHVMLVCVVPGRPRASMTAPVAGTLFTSKLCSTAQMLVRLFPNMLASLKALVTTLVRHPVCDIDVQT